jgi:hypothetical protein
VRRETVRAIGLWTAAALIGVAARADYRQIYLDAQRAERDGRLAAAATGYEAAAREHPQEAGRARVVGAIPEPYLPFHRLGVVSFELGRCRQAIDAFERSAKQGVAAKLEAAAAEAEPRLRECRSRVASEAARIPAVSPESRPVQPPANGATSSTGKAPPAVSSEPSPEAGPSPLSDVAGRDRAQNDAPPQVAPVAAPASPALAPTLPPSLRAAVEAYFAGSYSTAVDLASRQLPALVQGSGAEFIARLIRGAGRYSLYLLDGERDSAALLGATEDLRAAQRLRPGFRPPSAQFSPRLVTPYERIAAEPAGPAAR